MPDVLQRIRTAVRALFGAAPGARSSRSYSGAARTRTTAGFGVSGMSADAALGLSLSTLRNRSRQLMRDSAFARRARDIIVNNTIGTGIGLQAQVTTAKDDGLNSRVNDAIEAAWETWTQAAQCHTGGVLAFADLERLLMGEVFEGGEVLVRVHLRAFGGSGVPLSLEVIEPERLADEFTVPVPVGGLPRGHELRLGVELDAYQRPVAYYIRERQQGDLRQRMDAAPDRFERVPADQVFHLRRLTRWPQTRGEPWLHTVVRKLDDLDQYSQHEVTAARAAAAYFATIESDDGGAPVTTDTEDDGQKVMDIDPLTVMALTPGEKLTFHTPNRPNSAFDGFVRSILREIAAGAGTSYESLSRDYSQSNYSSSRLALLDDRDGYRVLQQWWLRAFRRPLHALWLQQAVLAGAVPGISVEAYALNRQRFEAALFKLRGWSWVDPTREVKAYKEAVMAGFTTITDVIAGTAGGLDIEDVIQLRRRELDMLAKAGIQVDTTPAAAEPEADVDPDEGQAPASSVKPFRKTA